MRKVRARPAQEWCLKVLYIKQPLKRSSSGMWATAQKSQTWDLRSNILFSRVYMKHTDIAEAGRPVDIHMAGPFLYHVNHADIDRGTCSEWSTPLAALQCTI